MNWRSVCKVVLAVQLQNAYLDGDPILDLGGKFLKKYKFTPSTFHTILLVGLFEVFWCIIQE